MSTTNCSFASSTNGVNIDFSQNQYVSCINITGTESSDVLTGNSNNNTIYGLDGDDTLNGAEGDNILIGGAGADTFLIPNTPGNTTIIDFEINTDREKINLKSFPEMHSVSDVKNRVRQSGNNVQVTLSSSQTLILKNIRKEDLSDNNFIFLDKDEQEVVTATWWFKTLMGLLGSIVVALPIYWLGQWFKAKYIDTCGGSSKPGGDNKPYKMPQEIVTKITDILKVFSTSAVTQEEKVKMLTNVREAERIFQDINNDTELFQRIFTGNVEKNDTINYLRLSISLANSYLYRDRDEEGILKAQRILKTAEKIIGAYIGYQKTNGKDLSKITENSILYGAVNDHGMLEIYTKVCYFYGRTYIYLNTSNRDYDKAEYYFKRALYLGNREKKLFEAYQSQIVGLGILWREKIILKAKNGTIDKQDAITQLKQVVAFYDSLLIDKEEYQIIHYQSHDKTVPVDNARCMLDCWEHKIRCYTAIAEFDKTLGVKDIIKEFTSKALLNGDYLDNKKRSSIITVLSKLVYKFFTQQALDADIITNIKNWITPLEAPVTAELNTSVEKSKTFSDLSLALLDIAYQYVSHLKEGLEICRFALEILKNNSDKALIEIWEEKKEAARSFLIKIVEKQDSCSICCVGGDIKTDNEKAMLFSDFEVNLGLLGIPILKTLSITAQGYKILIIDSDKDTREYSNNKKEIEVIYSNIQGETFACGDNALITSLKARALGLQSYVYVKDSHAVAVILYPEDKDSKQILEDINNAEINNTNNLWETYKKVMLDVDSQDYQRESNGDIKVEHLIKEAEIQLSDQQALVETSNTISFAFESVSYQLYHQAIGAYEFISDVIEGLQNVIPKTIGEENILIQAIERFMILQRSYQVTTVLPPKTHPGYDPDDGDHSSIGILLPEEPVQELLPLVGNGTFDHDNMSIL